MSLCFSCIRYSGTATAYRWRWIGTGIGGVKISNENLATRGRNYIARMTSTRLSSVKG
jgi:hypothetical protein